VDIIKADPKLKSESTRAESVLTIRVQVVGWVQVLQIWTRVGLVYIVRLEHYITATNISRINICHINFWPGLGGVVNTKKLSSPSLLTLQCLLDVSYDAGAICRRSQKHFVVLGPRALG